MKKLLYLGIILILASCGSNESESAASNESTVNVNGREVSTVKIGNLEVMTEDLGEMNWDAAIKACAVLGDGWRLPTKNELNVLKENKDEIGSFANNYYWSSTEVGRNDAWKQGFPSGNQTDANKSNWNYVRAVRAFASNESTVNVNIREVSTVKIGNLEVMDEDGNITEMDWDEAIKACADLGDGWRLPTQDELNILYQNKDEIGGFVLDYYWSSTEFDNGIASGAWIQYFHAGSQAYDDKNDFNYVRAVRAF